MKKGVLKNVILASLVLLPVVAYIVAQFVNGFFTIVSVVVLVIIVGIIAFNFIPRSALIRNSNKKINFETSATYPTAGGVEHKHVKEEFKLLLSEMKPRVLATKILSLVFCVLMIGGSFLMYYFFTKKVYDSGATLVDAKVVGYIDRTERTVTYTGGEKRESETYACEAIFSYELDGEIHEVTHRFNGISSFKASDIKIYVKDNKFVATRNQTIFGIVFAAYYLLLAIIHFARIFFATDIMTSVVGGIFSSIGGVAIQSFQVSLRQLLFHNFGAVIVILTVVGVVLLFTNVPTIRIYSHTKQTLTIGVGVEKK